MIRCFCIRLIVLPLRGLNVDSSDRWFEFLFPLNLSRGTLTRFPRFTRTNRNHGQGAPFGRSCRSLNIMRKLSLAILVLGLTGQVFGTVEDCRKEVQKFKNDVALPFRGSLYKNEQELVSYFGNNVHSLGSLGPEWCMLAVELGMKALRSGPKYKRAFEAVYRGFNMAY
jgi:hypothetical protein